MVDVRRLKVNNNLSFSCAISVVPVECLLKEIRTAIHSCYCMYCDSSYMFRLCEVAIMGR